MTFYTTTPIYYPSGKYHIGTAYTEVLADMLSRYHKLKGEDTFFLTGSDEHGQKVQTKALENDMSPKAYVDKMAEQSISLWEQMDIKYDKYIRTTDEYHIKACQAIFEHFLKQGDIYKGTYEGWYCEPCESYFTDTQIVDGKCPDCGRDVKKMSEESYFFKMSKYVDKLLQYYDEHPEFVEPAYRKSEMINNFIKPGLEDLCVTRNSFDWGIPVKSDPKHVIYVWLDALMNYITGLGYESDDTSLFEKFWPASVQIVGKDIARFHLICWPIFLMALGLPLPKTVFVHNWITMKDGKMSKSKGNVIYPEQLMDRYGLDATKYFLIRQIPNSADGVFTPEGFVERYNFDLVNDFSNLLNRTISMVNKYFDGEVPEDVGQVNEADSELEKAAKQAIVNFEEKMAKFEFAESLQEIWNFVSRTNKYIDETAPWALAKSEEEEDKAKLKSVMYHLVFALKEIAILIRPLMEKTSNETLRQLGIYSKSISWNSLEDNTDLKGIKVVSKGEPIFMRVNEQEEIEYIKNLMKK